MNRFFFFNDTATTEIYTLSLHDALPISDLLAAVESGQVAGAAIDVWTEEPPKSDVVRRLVAHPAVVVTPHLGANSAEAQVNVALDVARQLVAFRDGALVEYAVNIPVGDVGALEEMRPFLALADRLGRFSVQLDPEHLSSVEVKVAGGPRPGGPQPPAPAPPGGPPAPGMAGAPDPPQPPPASPPARGGPPRT